MLLLIPLLLFLAVFLIFLITPLKIKIIYCRKDQNDYLAAEIFMLGNRLPVRLELYSLDGPGRIFKPFLKIRGKLTGGKRPIAYPKKILSPSRLYRICYKIMQYFHLFKPALHYMAKRTKILDFRWNTKLGFKDAASTGMVTGALWTFKGLFSSILYQITDHQEKCPQITINPVFNQKLFDTELDCIFEVHPGHIIITVLKTIKLWLSSQVNPGREEYARPAPN